MINIECNSKSKMDGMSGTKRLSFNTEPSPCILTKELKSKLALETKQHQVQILILGLFKYDGNNQSVKIM